MNSASILLVANYSNRTGYAWNNIYQLFNEISRVMHERGVQVCMSFAKLEPPIDFVKNDFHVSAFEFDPHNITLESLFKIFKEVKRRNIKYVYFTDQKSYWWLYAVLRIAGVKRIIVHSRVSVSSPFSAEPEKGFLKLVKSMLGRVNFIVPNKIYAVSHFVKQRLVYKNCLPEDRVVVILNGIDINKYKCEPNVHDRGKIVVFAGARATKYKGIATLIDAVRLLVQEYKLTNFLVRYAGDGPDIKNFKRKIEENRLEDHYIFVGELKDTSEYLCDSDIVVVPSVWGDACPSAVSEALAAGKPLITTYAGGIPEIIGDEGNAILIQPSDEKQLAEALAKLIKNKELRIVLGKNSRRRAEDALGQERYYRETIDQLIRDLF